ncbi:unnamed protein product [Colias eurytheme]|nr:unnamed protein product [Colias eurytheme]
MRSLNVTACAALLEDVRWDEPTSVASLAVLALIDVLVITGNCLVIAAVLCSSKLRSVTNLFIVSLAVADLLVGLAVLPFSATREVFKEKECLQLEQINEKSGIQKENKPTDCSQCESTPSKKQQSAKK